MSAAREALLAALADEAQGDPEVLGMMVQGSVARGDALPGSDLDLFVLLRPGRERAFAAREREGFWVERHFADAGKVRGWLCDHPMVAYGFVESRILHDPDGELAAICRFAEEVLRDYRTPDRELTAIAYWLASVRRKIGAALDAGDLLRAGYVAATSSWKVLEGIWAINHRPIPPSGALPAHLADLADAPPGWPALFARLFQGDDRSRIDATLVAIDWFLARSELVGTRHGR